MAQIRTATIANGEAVSSAVEINARNINYEMGSLILEGTYTNTSFDVQVQIEDTWFDIYDTFGTKYSVSVNDGKHSLPADVFKDVNKVRLKGASNEASARTAKFLLIDILD
jgi:hypothetical protein